MRRGGRTRLLAPGEISGRRGERGKERVKRWLRARQRERQAFSLPAAILNVAGEAKKREVEAAVEQSGSPQDN